MNRSPADDNTKGPCPRGPTEKGPEMAKASVLPYDNVGMSAINRCDRCGAQAYVEVQLLDSDGKLLFCRHHADDNWDALLELNAIIADHRPFLDAEEHVRTPLKK